MKTFINIAIYQLIWLLCVLGGTGGAYGGIVLLFLHLLFSQRRSDDLRMMGFMFFVGLLVDGTLSHIGFFSFTTTGFPIPFWLMIVWLGLAITPHHGLRWMKHKPLLCMLFGALGGPVAYWAGVRLGAASFNWDLAISLLTLAVIWAGLWPAVMHFSVAAGKRPIKTT